MKAISTIHLISHTHWDREWYLPFQQFRLKLVRMLDRLLTTMEHDPGYSSFLLDGQAVILEDYLQLRPEKEAELKQLIMDGRIQIGPWYVSPDEFLISPESHLRNLLEGDRLCQKFGGKMMVGYLPDNFGHIGQMPQILQGFGIDNACLWRGLDAESLELTWKAPDGSQVLLSYLRDSYSNAASLTTNDADKFRHQVDQLSQSLAPYAKSGEIILMQGTDHMEPVAGIPEAIETFNKGSHTIHLVQSSFPNYFNRVRASLTENATDLPEMTGELRSSRHSALLRQVLSTHMDIKQRNQACENDLLHWIEPIIAWVNMVSHPADAHSAQSQLSDKASSYDLREIIRFSWKQLMLCHPHDTICATSIDQVIKELQVRFDQVDQINAELIRHGLQELSEHIDTRFAGHTPDQKQPFECLTAIVVYNPAGFASSGPVSISYQLPETCSTARIMDDSGHPVSSVIYGMGSRELISMVMDRKGLQQALSMIHEGNIAGLVIRDFSIETAGNKATIQATMADHGQVDLVRWKQGLSQVEAILSAQEINEFLIRARFDPEISESFIASDIPAHGYRTYWISGSKQPAEDSPVPMRLPVLGRLLMPLLSRGSGVQSLVGRLLPRKPIFHKELHKLENEHLLVEVEPSNGTLVVTDKRTRQVYPGLNQFVDSGDRGDLYNYCPPVSDLTVTPFSASFRHLSDQVQQQISVSYRMKIPSSLAEDRKSRSRDLVELSLTSEITLLPGTPRVDIRTVVNNTSEDHRLRVHFPAPFGAASAWFDGHYEIVERPTRVEVYDGSWEEPPRGESPQREFTCINNNRYSLMIANRGLPEVEVLTNHAGNAEIAFTLLRCVGWLSRDDLTSRKGHAGPMGIETPGAQMKGHYSFDYSIIPGDGDWHASIPYARVFTSPIRPVVSTIHPGDLPNKASMVENSCRSFTITAIKSAENGVGLIVRGYNCLAETIEVSLKPWRSFKKVEQLRLDEKYIQTCDISPDGAVHLHVEGHKIITLRFTD